MLDLRVVEQTLTVRRDAETLKYRLVESGRISLPVRDVSPNVFRPEPELLGIDSQQRVESRSRLVESHTPRRLSASALVGLEVEALRLLDSAGALVGEQWELKRAPAAQLWISAVVDTEARKAQLAEALAPLKDSAAVRLELQVATEALKRQKTEPGQPPTFREVDIINHRIAVYGKLQQYFSTQPETLASEKSVDETIVQFSRRVTSLSRQALLEAGLLKRLVGRYSTTDLQAVNPHAYAAWRRMIWDHARRFQEATEAVQRQLQPIFFWPLPANESTGDAIKPFRLDEAINRLFELATAHDQAVQSALTLSASGSNGKAIQDEQLWRSLGHAAELATRIQQEP
jgi:hypothetical protein